MIFYLVYFSWFFGEILKTNIFQGSTSPGKKIKTKNRGSSLLIGIIIFISIFMFFLFTGYRINLTSNWIFYPAIASLIFYLLYIIKILWTIIFLSIESSRSIDENDKGSALLIIVSNFIIITVAFLFAGYNIALLPTWIFIPGIVLMIIGFIIRQWSIAILGYFFSSTVGVKKNHKLIDIGPYQLIRHLSYTAGFMFVIGLGLTLQSWGTIIIAIIMSSIAYSYRIHREENLLITKFGNEYIKYMKRTKKLIPYIL